MSEGEVIGPSELSRERSRKSKVIDRKADGSWNSPWSAGCGCTVKTGSRRDIEWNYMYLL